jgi:prophage regulatory protein
MTESEGLRLLRLPEVRAKTGLGRTEIYMQMAAGRFPKSVKIGKVAVAWPSDEIDFWIAARLAERDAEGERPAPPRPRGRPRKEAEQREVAR